MELLRKPPFPLVLTYSGLSANTAVVATFASSKNTFLEDIETVTDGNGLASFTLTERFSRYDGEYSVTVYEGTSESKGWAVVMDTLRCVRPYVDSAALAPAGREAEFAKFERIARTMIDNIVGGFYYKNANLELQGSGTDKLVVGNRINKLLKVVENGIVLYELDGANNVAEFAMSKDHDYIYQYHGSEHNKIEGVPLSPRLAESDSFSLPLRSGTFRQGFDYEVTVEIGYPMVPQDIKEATELIIEDMACGEPNYWSKYVREYETKDYRLDFHRSMFAGTGNLIVDQILQRYFGDTLYHNIRVL